MRAILASAAVFILFSPFAQAQSLYSADQETTRMLDEFDAYHEGVENGRTALHREQEQGWNRSYSSGCR